MQTQTIDDLGIDFDTNEQIEILHREPLDTIDIYFVYIDSDMGIEKIVCENEPIFPLENQKHGINKNRIFEFIQQKKNIDSKKYKLLDFFYFHVPLEHEQLQNFIKNTSLECPEFMKSPSYLTDLVIEDSISIFQDINSLFFFFKSTELRHLSKTAKSLSKISHTENKPRVTKKVRFLT